MAPLRWCFPPGTRSATALARDRRTPRRDIVPRCPRGGRAERSAGSADPARGLGRGSHHVEEQATESHADRERVGQLIHLLRRDPGSRATLARMDHGPRPASAAWTRFARRAVHARSSSEARAPLARRGRRSASTEPAAPRSAAGDPVGLVDQQAAERSAAGAEQPLDDAATSSSGGASRFAATGRTGTFAGAQIEAADL